MLALLNKIQAVAQELKSIEKDMVVGTGKNAYKAVSDQMVTLKVKAAEEKNKILSVAISQDLVSSEYVKLIKENKEQLLYTEVIKMTLRIYDLEDEKSYIDVTTHARGIDYGDKGFGKASTYARKYALLNAYKIATGEDPDNMPSETESTSKAPDEIEIAVRGYFEKNNNYLVSCLQHFGAQTVEDFTKDNFKAVYETLSKKKLV